MFISGQLLIFYTIFYAVLAALFAICMMGLNASLDERKPTYILDRSIIGINPGMGFRPMSNRTEEGSLIWFNSKNATTIRKWINLLNEFLKRKLNLKKFFATSLFCLKIYTTLGYIVSLILLNLGHVFRLSIVNQMTHTADDAKAKHVSQVQED